MKKWVKVLTIAAMAVMVGAVSKVDFASAAQIVGVHQTDDGKNDVEISWDADLAVNTSDGRYRVEISQDNVSWMESEVVSGTSLNIYGLTAGKSYYVRVSGYSDSSCTQMIAEPSAPFEVVTEPDMTNAQGKQSDATTSSYSVTISNVTGANWYIIEENDSVLGSSSKPTIKVSNCSTGTSYTCRVFACRKSASGYVAKTTWDYVSIYNVKTLTKQPAVSQFGITNAWYNINSYKVEISNTLGAYDGAQFQFMTTGGKVKKSVTTTGDYAYIDKFINGTFYKYRARTYVNCGGKNKYSKWSSFRTIALPKSVSGTASSKKVIRMNWSSVSGASGYDIYISSKQYSGYKKVKSLSSKNRSITIKKYGKKSLKKGATYYLRIIPKAKSGKSTIKAQIYWSGSVRIPTY